MPSVPYLSIVLQIMKNFKFKNKIQFISKLDLVYIYIQEERAEFLSTQYLLNIRLLIRN